jgi:tRNA G10  N-methylase Trm11
MFAGHSEYGIRIDIKPETKPSVIGDCHRLPFKENSFDMVLADPPYTNELSERIYGTGKVVYKKWVSEAVRVCKPGGYIAVYHMKMLPRPKGTSYHRRIFLGVRIWHNLRCVGIYRKE